MAQWKETLEPYIKVHEEIKTTTLNPTAGEDLIIGVALISDAGPATPTLITSQSDFIKTYASQDITKDYIESLNGLYLGSDKTIAATMWSNAYRLAGSNTMLVVRASKANDIYFTKPLSTDTDNNSVYVLRDGELLKKVPSFKIVKDQRLDNAEIEPGNGWSISINGVGVIGNRTTDDGAQYDYFVNNLPDLVDVLNDTSKFFSPSYKFYSDDKGTEETELTIDLDSSEADKGKVNSVIFEEVYLGADILDMDDPRVVPGYGMTYLVTCERDWTMDNPSQKTVRLNDTSFSGFVADPYYATNVFNSATNLKVRIRRFNHDAVVSKELSDSEKTSLTKNGPSQYLVLDDVLKTFTKDGSEEPSENTLYRDFYEVAVIDPSVNDIVSFFAVGNILGRGDIEVSELNNLLNMVQFTLPDNMHDLGLNYYNYGKDDYRWRVAKKDEYLVWRDATDTEKDQADSFIEVVETPKDPVIYEEGNADTKNNIYKIPVLGSGEITYYVYIGSWTSTAAPSGEYTGETYDSYQDLPPVSTNNTVARIASYTYYQYNNGEWGQLSERPENFDDSNTYGNLEDVINPEDGDTVRIAVYTYYMYGNIQWTLMSETPSGTVNYTVTSINDLPTTSVEINQKAKVDTTEYNYRVYVYSPMISDPVATKSELEDCIEYDDPVDIPSSHRGEIRLVIDENKYYIFDKNGCDTLFADLTIDPFDYTILKISDTDLKRALDQIALDEVYTTEGLSDLGNTEPSYQSYMANMAINLNYFYPISTLNSTNYMTIGNGATKISQDSYKLYMSSPWDIDTGTLGWKYYASPSVLYWESVARNRRNNNEFASIIGQSNGIMQYQRPVVEFNKRSRQLLLSKRVNTVLWNVATQAWNMNDCYTKQNENNIMGEDGNSRLGIRICKAMPTLLRQFIGKKITEKLCEDVKAVIRYFFTTTILPMNYTVESYNIICNYDEALARQNKIKVIVQVRFSRSLKFIDVYAEYYDVGMEFEEPIR